MRYLSGARERRLRAGGVRIAASIMTVSVAACLQPHEPQPLPECAPPTYSTAGWERVDGFASILVPPSFLPVTPTGPWERGQTWERGTARVSLGTRSSAEAPSGTPVTLEVTGGCRAVISGRTALVEFARVPDDPNQSMVLATWRNVPTGGDMVDIVFTARTNDGSDLPLILAMIHSVQIAPPQGPGS